MLRGPFPVAAGVTGAMDPVSGFPGNWCLDTSGQCWVLHQHLGRVKCPTGFGDQHRSCKPGSLCIAYSLIAAFLHVCCLFFQVGEAAVHIQGQEPLTASVLAAAPPQEQKQMIGECQGCPAGVRPAVGLCGRARAHGLAGTRENSAARRSCKPLWDCSDIMLL